MSPTTTELIVALALGTLACGGDSSSAEGGDAGAGHDASEGGGTDSPADAPFDADVDASQVPSYDLHASDRLACLFAAGDTTTKTVGPQVPHGDALPFKHIVFLMMENRSFDSYFSKLGNVDAADETYSNPQPGPPVSTVHRYHETRYCIADTTHDWGPVHLQYDMGAMDGFVITTDPGGERSMGYYDEGDIPYYYWVAKTFAISDRHFSPLLGPTWPNRFFFYGATSWGRTETPDTPPLNKEKIVNEMDTAGRTWKIYYEGSTSFAIAFGPMYAGTSMSDFFADVAADTLPDLAILDPTFSGSGEDDEHPPSDIQKGQQLSASVLGALMSNPTVWQSTVFIQTYDEHGGMYDHVPPPPACIPDGYTPPDYAFDRYGVRVPLMIAAPWVKKAYVSHVVTDHTSITRFIENRFDLPAMTARDANAWPLLDMFDFQTPAFMTPPTGAPPATPSQAGLDWCANNPPGTGYP